MNQKSTFKEQNQNINILHAKTAKTMRRKEKEKMLVSEIRGTHSDLALGLR
jgi:hypothetical protein